MRKDALCNTCLRAPLTFLRGTSRTQSNLSCGAGLVPGGSVLVCQRYSYDRSDEDGEVLESWHPCASCASLLESMTIGSRAIYGKCCSDGLRSPRAVCRAYVEADDPDPAAMPYNVPRAGR